MGCELEPTELSEKNISTLKTWDKNALHKEEQGVGGINIREFSVTFVCSV
jgi:hypothetical protein